MEVDVSFFQSILNNPMLLLVLVMVLFGVVLIAVVLIARYFILGKNKVSKAFERKLILVTMPQASENKQEADNLNLQQVQEKIGVMESLFATLAGVKSEKGFKAWLFGHKDVFSLEMAVLDGKIHFFIAVPAHYQNYVEEQITAQFPNAYLEERPDYNFFTPKGYIKGMMLGLAKADFLPIKTYKKADSDPLNSVINALSKVDEKDGAAIQIIMKSAKPGWRDFGLKVASKMQQGKKFKDAYKEAKGGFFASLRSFFPKGKSDSPEQPPEQYRLSPFEEEQVKGIEETCNKAGVDTNIRIIVSSENKAKLDAYLHNISNSFSQYKLFKFGNRFEKVSRPFKRLINDFIYRKFDEGRSFVLNTEELASVYHFPFPKINSTPTIKWLQAKKAPAPMNMPREGIVLGKNFYRGKETTVRMKTKDRHRHMYIIGQTGTGKTYFATGMAMQDIRDGHGVCYIDPHGDDLDNILAHIPKERAEDVILFDPADTSRPFGLNMLEYENTDQKTFVVNEVMNILDKLYDLRATGGPMFEQYFKNACMLVMDDPESGSTLMEVPRVMSDDEFRRLKLSRCKTPTVKSFWEKEAEKAGGEASLENMVPYITSKLAPFLANDFLRPIISQQKTTIDFRKAMDEQKIILVKLSKGKLGDINAHLLGMLIVGKILMAALDRSDMPEEERKEFYLYIDEFQNFLTESIEVILSEARKYRLCLTIAHQYIGQLVKQGDTKFRDAIFGNVGTKVAFRIGVDDAELLAKEFDPVFNEADFLNVPKFNCFVKLLIDNANPPGFNMGTLPHEELDIPEENQDLAKAIAKLSKLKYGRDKSIVTSEISERMNKF